MSGDKGTGMIPKGWSTASLGELEARGLVKLGRGKVISKRDIVSNPGDYPIYSSAGQNGGEFGRYGSYLFDEELITWSVDGGGHLFYRKKHRFSVTNVGGWLRILDFEAFVYKYLFFALTYLHSNISFDWSRKAHPSVIRLAYDAIPILQIEEQERIVEILEEQFSGLDAALSSIRAVRKKAARFRRSLLHAAFTGALTGHNSSSGTLPNDWRLLKIADFASVKGGKRLPKGTQWSEVETNHPYIRATDIKNGKINEENLVYVPEKTWPTISRYIVATNDVIITIAGTIGSVAVVPETLNEANLTENAAKICHLQNVLARFLQLYLMSPETQTVISGLSTSTTQAKLALFRIESIEVPIPSLSEQQKIVQIVDTQISILDQSLSLLDAVERKASSMRRSLLHSAFTGELTKEWRENSHV